MNIVLPYITAFAIEAILSSRITISPASLAISVPLPIAKPTSALFKAGASLMPSPVMPTTSPISCASLTSRLLSVGSARATTRIEGSRFLTSLSLKANSSLLVITCSSSLPVISPDSFATAAAVSLLSPVISTTCIPAPLICLTAQRAFGLSSSRIPTSPIRIRREKSPRRVTGASETASASTRTAFFAICFILLSSRSRLSSRIALPLSLKYLSQ